MAEYRIIAKVDPQTGPGTQKVKQDLKGIQTEAKATETALNRSFDQQKFDKTIGSLVSRMGQLDKKLDGVQSSAGNAGKAFDKTTGSIERMTAAEFRAAGGLEGLNKQAQQGAASQTQLEAALRRVLQATDAEAAEQMRLNKLLADAKVLLDANLISHERYAQVQKLVANGGKDLNTITGSQRIGLQQLGFQLGDVATMYSLGARPAQIFASQIGQVSQALMLMGGDSGGGLLGKVGRFLGGPWGIAVTLATIVLGPMVAKLFESNDAIEEGLKKKRDDAKETANTREVHERWIKTLDALIDRQGKLADAMKDRLKVQGLADEQDLRQAQSDKAKLDDEVAKEQARLANLKQQLARASTPIQFTGRGSEAALGQQALEISRIQDLIKKSEAEVARLQKAASDATTRIVGGTIIVGEQQGKALVDLTAKAQQYSDRYQAGLRGILLRNEDLRKQAPQVSAGFELIKAAIDKAASAGLNFDRTGNQAKELGRQLDAGKISAATYRSEMAKLAAELTKAAEAAEKAKRSVGDGVATFKSQTQAIGIAGRELQQAGFRVSENPQFGGVTPGSHKGAGHAEGRAIDVNVGTGVVEANVPDIRAQIEATARRYAARGYIVLFNGKRYDPSGKVTDIPSGQDQHTDHFHLEAPATIVGKPTQASTEAQARREEQVQERAEDFVANVVKAQAAKGIPANAQSQLDAAIKEALTEFEIRFNRVASAEEKATITKAFTDADARATAQRFDEAYVQPLIRLQALQGKVGLDREVLNAQLEESKRLGRELTDVEKAQIENGIRNGDQLNRQAQILQQVKGPLAEYKAMIDALNASLAKGEISQAAYNARIAEMGANAAHAALGGLGPQAGVDPASGRPYEDVIAIADENARYAEQLSAFETYRQQLLQLGVDYDALELAARQQHAENLAQIDRARRDVQLSYMQQAASSVTSIMQEAFGKQSKIARAAFVAEKAIAIARASIALAENVAQAAKIGFPQNLPFIAGALAQGVTIMASIRSAGAAIAGGEYKEGGWTGDGQRDSEAGTVHGQEFVVKAPYARDNRALLEAINSGRQVRHLADGRAREAAVANGGGSAPVVVPPAQVNLRMINVTDKRMVADFFDTPEGEQVFVNLLNSNADTVARVAGQSGAS